MAYTPQIQNKISTLNSYSSSLSGSQVFQGTGEDVSKYGRAGVSIWTPYASASAGTLTIEVSRDGVQWGGPTRRFEVTNIAQPHMWNIVEKYFRIKYIPDAATPNIDFQIQTQYSVNADILLGHQLDEVPIDEHEAILTKAVNWGVDPTGTYVANKTDGVAFSTETALSASATYTSSILNATGYTQVQTHIVSDQDGTATFRFYSDAAGTTELRTLSIPYTATTGFQLLSAPAFSDYIRYDYTNGTVDQSTFYYGTKFLTKALSGQVLSLNSNISAGMVANLGRNVIVGQDNAGNFRNSTVDEHGDLKTHIHEPTTAFGELMTADMDPQIQITFPYNINTNIVTPTTSSTNATVTQADAMAVISTGATAGASASLHSNRTVKYRAGQGIDVRFTALFTTGSSVGTRQMAGVGNFVNGQPVDGYFFGMSGSSFGTWTYNNSVGTFVSSSGFGTDRFNGTGDANNPSGVNIQPEKGNVYQIKYQYLGYGAIKYSIEDPIEGFYSEAHLVEYANANFVPATTNPTFPIVYYVNNGTNAENIVLKTASGAAFVGGKNKITGPTQSTGSVIAASAGDQLLFALQGVTEMPSGSGQTSYVNSYLRNLAIANEGANNTIVSLEVRENITITSPIYKYIDTNNSAVRAVNGTYVAGSGKKLLKIQVPRGTAQTLDLTDFEYELAPGKNIAFILGGDASTSTEVDVSWVEDF